MIYFQLIEEHQGYECAYKQNTHTDTHALWFDIMIMRCHGHTEKHDVREYKKSRPI